MNCIFSAQKFEVSVLLFLLDSIQWIVSYGEHPLDATHWCARRTGTVMDWPEPTSASNSMKVRKLSVELTLACASRYAVHTPGSGRSQ